MDTGIDLTNIKSLVLIVSKEKKLNSTLPSSLGSPKFLRVFKYFISDNSFYFLIYGYEDEYNKQVPNICFALQDEGKLPLVISCVRDSKSFDQFSINSLSEKRVIFGMNGVDDFKSFMNAFGYFESKSSDNLDAFIKVQRKIFGSGGLNNSESEGILHELYKHDIHKLFKGVMEDV